MAPRTACGVPLSSAAAKEMLAETGRQMLSQPSESVRRSFAHRFPKWNPRYVAYALAHGADATEAGILEFLEFRELFSDKAGFIAWIAQQREAFRLEQRIPRHDLTRDQEKAFDRWIERRFAQDEAAGARS